MDHSEDHLQVIIDTIPTLAWSAGADGSAEFFNRRWLDYTGLSAKQARDWAWTVAIHPDDLNGLVGYWRSILASGEPGKIEGRLRRFDGVYRWFLFRATPSLDEHGRVIKWFGTNTDIEDRKRAESLLAGENRVLEMVAKGNSLESTLEALCHVVEQTDSGCYCSVVLVDASGSKIQQAVAPSLPSSYNEFFPGKPLDRESEPCTAAARHKVSVVVSDVASDTRWNDEWRRLALGHSLRSCWSMPILSSDGGVLGTFAIYWREAGGPTQQHQRIIEQLTHLTVVAIEHKRTEDAQRASQRSLRLMIDKIPGFVYTRSPAGEFEIVNQRILDYLGTTLERLKTDPWVFVYEDDRELVTNTWKRSTESGGPHESEHRIRRADGVYRWFQVRGLPLRDTQGRIVRWYMLATDIDDRKKAEEKLLHDERELRRSEADLLEAQRLSHTGSWKQDVSSGKVTVSPEVHRIFDIKPHEDASSAELYFSRVHPEDRMRTQELFKRSEIQKAGYQTDYRIVLPDGTLRHQHAVGHPVLNESGELVEFVRTVMDDTEQWHARAELESAFEEIKRLKDRLHDENLVLREQIDQAFMFEEIVGSSPTLQAVLSNIVKVAPTDSTVLITGETGTGKELIARAIHKRSQRSGHAFISVNCASIPTSLIASELFGHEKGAFTGAVQKRQGRFEQAHCGSIFLDEIGDLPAETQIALLRVLQERQFQRVGGNRFLPTDVRVIAATNRDLPAAIAAGAFRADLFYRLNVFPIQVPPLRKRKQDIPMLVEYYAKRYAKKMGKQIRRINKNTLKICMAYDWPGNIRELQNIIERSVILCNGDTFWVDPAWLSGQESLVLGLSGPLTETLENHEKEIIEAALAETKGKVAGSKGAAAKLGIPRSTLDSKIKQLKIMKHKFTSEL